jgi:hypothetical protein
MPYFLNTNEEDTTCVIVDNIEDWLIINTQIKGPLQKCFKSSEKLVIYPVSKSYSEIDYAKKMNYTIYELDEVKLKDEHSYSEALSKLKQIKENGLKKPNDKRTS